MGPPRGEDAARIRAVLESDRPWAAYALADLSPGFREHCQWFVGEGADPLIRDRST